MRMTRSIPHTRHTIITVHQVLDSSNESKVGDWILTTSSSEVIQEGHDNSSLVLYNVDTRSYNAY